jgi:hypothetical protein
MKDLLSKLMAWIKANSTKAIIIAIVVIFVFFGRKLKRIFFAPRRVRHRVTHTARRRSLPRSVGMRKAKGSYTRGGAKKKPWQIKGSLAARRHMAQIRARR